MLTLFYFLFLCLHLWAEVPKVVVTPKHLHSLVAGIMEGIGVLELLLKDSLSPHHSFLNQVKLKNSVALMQSYGLALLMKLLCKQLLIH